MKIETLGIREDKPDVEIDPWAAKMNVAMLSKLRRMGGVSPEALDSILAAKAKAVEYLSAQERNDEQRQLVLTKFYQFMERADSRDVLI